MKTAKRKSRRNLEKGLLCLVIKYFPIIGEQKNEAMPGRRIEIKKGPRKVGPEAVEANR